MAHKSIGVALLTLNAEKYLPRLLPPLLNSPLKPKILLIDSESTDQTVLQARKQGIETLSIPRNTFNHGLTREKARKELKTDLVAFFTQDAFLLDESGLENLCLPLLQEKAAMSYARQIPRLHAGLFEAFAREFNYPKEAHIRGLEDINTYGSYTFFASNSAAAYANEALDQIGGFPEVLLGEDTIACAKLLHLGHKVAYAADCHVEHSHNFTLVEEFKRHFDTGLSRSALAPLLSCAGSDTCRGKLYAKALLKRILHTSPWLLPYGVGHIMAKWLGYRLGRKSQNASSSWKRAFSSQPYYFK